MLSIIFFLCFHFFFHYVAEYPSKNDIDIANVSGNRDERFSWGDSTSRFLSLSSLIRFYVREFVKFWKVCINTIESLFAAITSSWFSTPSPPPLLCVPLRLNLFKISKSRHQKQITAIKTFLPSLVHRKITHFLRSLSSWPLSPFLHCFQEGGKKGRVRIRNRKGNLGNWH